MTSELLRHSFYIVVVHSLQFHYLQHIKNKNYICIMCCKLSAREGGGNKIQRKISWINVKPSKIYNFVRKRIYLNRLIRLSVRSGEQHQTDQRFMLDTTVILDLWVDHGFNLRSFDQGNSYINVLFPIEARWRFQYFSTAIVETT